MENYIKEVAKILNVSEKEVEDYIEVWRGFYDFETTSPKEFAEMIQDIIYLY